MSAVSATVCSSAGRSVRLAREPAPLSRAEAEACLGSYRNGIHAHLRRKGFGAEEADDLTQETLIRAYLHLAGFRGTSMAAWLYRIASNVAVDYLRKQRLAHLPLECAAQAPSADEDALARVERDERRAQVRALIAQLPECHQRILRLRYFEDLSLAEIAGEMDCTPMAAKLRVFRAMTALRKRCRSLPPEGEWSAG
jgi:RNA polymerase sigma factor (sigma-70 family)